MANISLSQKAAKALKIETKSLTALATANFDDWLGTDIWESKRNPWLFFMHKQSFMCFVVKPTKYKISEAIDSLLLVIRRYLDDNGMLDKYYAFEQSFKTIETYKNNDAKATANINSRRSHLYSTEDHYFDEEHLNYILNLKVQTLLYKDPNNIKEYLYMCESFNNYLESVPSFGEKSVKKPDYRTLFHLGWRDYKIVGSKYYQDVKQIFKYVPEHVSVNYFCGIAFGVMILSDDIENAITRSSYIAEDLSTSSYLLYEKNMLKSFFKDLIRSYANIMETNPQDMYSVDYKVPTKLSNISGNGLYSFSLGLYYTTFFLFKSEIHHQNHPIVMERQTIFQKLEDFVRNDSSNGNNLEYEDFVQDIPEIISGLYDMHLEAKVTSGSQAVH